MKPEFNPPVPRKETITDAMLDIAKSHYEALTGVPKWDIEDEKYLEGKKHRPPPINFKE